MLSLVLQTHPVKSAASLTTKSQSCFSHAHWTSGIYMTVSLNEVLPLSTDRHFLLAEKTQVHVYFLHFTLTYSSRQDQVVYPEV